MWRCQRPLLIVEADDPDGSDRPLLTLDQSRVVAGFWTSAVPDGFSHSVQILASGDTPGVLQPGESRRVPVYYAGLLQPWDVSDQAIELHVAPFTADLELPISWLSRKDELRPESIAADAWDAIYSNLTGQFGTTLGDYVRMLDDNAAYLGRLGQTQLDIRRLWSFEIPAGRRPESRGTAARRRWRHIGDRAWVVA